MKLRKFRNRAAMLPLYGLGLVFAVTCALLLESWNLGTAQHNLRMEMDRQASVISARFQREIISTEVMARSLSGALAATPEMDKAQFREIARQISLEAPSVLSITAAPDLVVDYVFPDSEQQLMLGLDYRNSARQLPAIREAIATQEVTLDGPLMLVRRGQGLAFRAPVFTPVAEGQKRYWGIASVLVDANALFRSTGVQALGERYSVGMRRIAADGDIGPLIYGDPTIFEGPAHLHRMSLPMGDWQLAMLPQDGWPSVAPLRELIWGGVFGITLLMIAVVDALWRLSHERKVMRRLLTEGIEAIDDGFAIFDPSDRLVMCNDRFKAYNEPIADKLQPGAPYEKLLRLGVKRGLFNPAEGTEEEWIAERLAAHREPQERIERCGENRWVKISQNRMPNGGIAQLEVDITDLREARIAAEQANRAKTDFLNNVSHELRTPLTVMMGYGAFLGNVRALPGFGALDKMLSAREDAAAEQESLGALQGAISKFSGQIDRSGQMLMSLINSILDWAKLEEGELRLDGGALDAETVVAEVGEQMRESAERKGLSLEVLTEPAQVQADATRLRQILFNLAGNAVKFTESGAVRLACRRNEDGAVEFVVEDSGPGIAAEHHEAIFERFKQVDGSVTRAHGGTGLGLAITKKLVELHEGRIEVTSAPGKGSRFTVTLPAAAATEVSAAA